MPGDLASWWRPDGLHLPEGLSFEAWQEVGEELQAMEHSVLFALGDWASYGERKYGEAASQAFPTGYSASTVRSAIWVAQKFAPADRRADLTWAHHREVAALPIQTASKLLDKAEKEHLTTGELRDEVRSVRSQAVQAEVRARQEADPEPAAYSVIVADPPWETMTVDDLCDSPPPAGPDAVCFLWAPVQWLPGAISVLDAWSLPYKAHFVWPSAGQGDDGHGPWVRYEHELVLLGARGDMIPVTKLSSMLSVNPDWPRHSLLSDAIETMYPGIARYEMFRPLVVDV